jgi:hypothetical protein
VYLRCKLGKFKDGDGVLTSNARKILQELVQRVAGFEIFNERLYGHPGTLVPANTVVPPKRSGDAVINGSGRGIFVRRFTSQI